METYWSSPIADGATIQWFRSPTSGTHFSAVDEPIASPDLSDKLWTNGLAKLERLLFEEGLPAGSSGTITEIDVQFHISGEAFTSTPGMQVDLYVGGLLKATMSINTLVAPAAGKQVTFSGLSISAADWLAGPREVYFTTLDGGGLPDPRDRTVF